MTKEVSREVMELSGASEDDAEIISSIAKESMEESMFEIFSDSFKTDILNKYAEIYEELFTPEELQALVEWQTSPLAKKVMEVQSDILLRGVEVGQYINEQVLGIYMTKFQTKMEEMDNEKSN